MRRFGMLFVLDIGNTHTCIGVFEGFDEVGQSPCFSHKPQRLNGSSPDKRMVVFQRLYQGTGCRLSD